MTIDASIPDLERPVADLGLRHFERNLRGLSVIGSWMGSPPEPVMVISNPAWQMGRIDPTRTNLCAIRLRDAWIFSEDAGAQGARAAAYYLFQFAKNLGLSEFNKMTMFRLLTVVQDCLPDLLMMPSRPPEHRRVVVADAILKRPDGKEIHAEVRDYV